jgi:hypothetical protein
MAGRASLRARVAETIGGREKCPKRIERRIEKSRPLQDTRNALRQLSCPRFGGPGDSGAESDNRRDHDKDEQKGPSALGVRNRWSARKAGCINRLSMTAKIIGKAMSLAT